MEDPRISRMYAAIMGRKLSGMRARVWRAAVLRSGMLTAIVLVLLLGGLIVFVKERGKGRLHRLEVELQSKRAVQAPPVPPPGGQDAMVLQRTPVAVETMPEFFSATLLPGRGMNVLQIMARIPSLGEVPLLVGPSLEEASKRMSGTGADAGGAASLETGAAIEAPWANRMGGAPTPDNEALLAVWKGLTVTLPTVRTNGAGVGTAVGGLLLKRSADARETHVLADGWQSRAVYHAGNFDGHWLSQTEVTTSVLLNSRVMELEVAAKNTGSAAEPLGIGWRAKFAIPSGDRANTQLRLPNGLLVERQPDDAVRNAGLPTGKLLPIEGANVDYVRLGGARLGTRTLNETVVHLKQGVLDIGPVVEMRDITGKFGLRITLLTPTIKAIRVEAPAGQATVTIDPQFNFDDPFGRQWPKDEDTGMAVVQPGQTVRWKIRIELFPLVLEAGPHF